LGELMSAVSSGESDPRAVVFADPWPHEFIIFGSMRLRRRGREVDAQFEVIPIIVLTCPRFSTSSSR
jgi:hypothetical protein